MVRLQWPLGESPRPSMARVARPHERRSPSRHEREMERFSQTDILAVGEAAICAERILASGERQARHPSGVLEEGLSTCLTLILRGMWL
jgi:hypothetical protein